MAIRGGGSGIYRLFNKSTAKFYIGSAVDLSLRWWEHKNRLKTKTHHSQKLQRAWDKYGEIDFEFQILEFCEKEKLIEREQYWIDQTNAVELGYNICAIGRNSLGAKRSQETRLKISLGNKGKFVSEETKAKLKKSWEGRKLPKIHGKKISNALTGRKRPPRTAEWKLNISKAMKIRNQKLKFTVTSTPIIIT